MKRDVLERNLEALFERAYIPKRPAPGFRAALQRDVAAELERRAARRSVSPTPPRRGHLWRIAAGLLVLAGAATLYLRDRPEPGATMAPPPDLAALDTPGASPPIDGLTEPGGPRGALAPVAAPAPELALQDDRDRLRGGLAGRVTDAAGAPLARFEVTLLPRRELPAIAMPWTRSFDDAAGRFHWPDVEPGDYTVFVAAADLATRRLEELRLAPDGDALPLDLRLAPGARVRGRVLDAESGAPVADALVISERDAPTFFLDLLAPWPERPFVARTDADGSFELPHLGDGEQLVRVSHPDFAPRWSEPFAVRDGRPAANDLHFELGPAARLEGVALRGRGSPLPGAGVFAMRSGLTNSSDLRYCISGVDVVSDAAGRWSAAGLSAGSHNIVLFLPQALAANGERMREIRYEELVAGKTVRSDFELRDLGTLLYGAVVGPVPERLADQVLRLRPLLSPSAPPPSAAAEGSEFAYWRAELFGSTPLEVALAGDGGFEFVDLLPVTYEAWLELDGERSTAYLGEFRVERGGEQRLDLEAGACLVHGRVTARDTGAPLPDVEVRWQRLDGGAELERDSGWARSDARGGFRAAFLEPGVYAFQASGAGVGYARAGLPEVVVDRPERPGEVELALEPAGRVTLSVVDADGRPVAGARVLWTDGRGEPRTWDPLRSEAAELGPEPTRENAPERDRRAARPPVTGADGRHVAADLAAGPWRVRVDSPLFARHDERVELRPRETLELEIVLRRGADR